VAEFIGAEELDRFEGAWWSADSRSIAYARVDERPVPPIEIGVDGSAAGERHHYPFPGGPNARVRLRVTPASRARSRDVDLGMGPDDYLARVVPHPGGGWLAAVLPRDQRSLRWYRVAASGSAVPLWVEHGDPWINLDDDTRVLADGRILRSSERSGHRHLVLRTPDGSTDRVLTAGDWVVTGVVGVSERRREVLFMATRDSVLERHLYAVSLDAEAPAEEPHRLTVEPGWHEVVASPDGERWIDTWSDLDRSTSVRLCSRDGVVDVIYPAFTSAAAEGLTPPALLDLVAADGKTPLSAAVYRPRRRRGEPAPPAVVWVYGGPHAQSVKRSWEMTVQRLRQYLCQAGAAVVVVDNRGAAFRGVSFESGIAGHLGGIEVADQAAAVRQLAARGELDPTRVGIVGGSYGGFMTVMAMAREPELFKVGVAISPVAEWAGYDTAYTERYLRTPAADPEAYRRSSAITHANEVRGDLLLIHGTLDENVHLRHSLRLREALAAAGRPVELVELAGQRHRVRGSAIGVREKRTLVHLLRGLGLPIPGELG
jgi:dipeptidyl-peptidase 4